MHLSRRNIWLSTRDYVFIVFGLLIYAFGFTGFILPEKVVIGGLVGVGSLVYFLLGIPVALTSYALNLVLLAIAYKIVGKQFVIRTVSGATVINFFIGVMQPMFPEPLIAQQTFMNIIIGGVLCGFGIGLAFTHNGSTGGTDIVAAMVSKRSNVSIGRMMLYCDFLKICQNVYGLVVTLLASFMADQVINTNRQAVQFTIISRYWQEIANAINNEARRGCTVLDGMGWYSKQEVKVLLVMCRKIESVTIFRIVKSIDKDAFITQANVNVVNGQGFDMVKLKMKNVKHEHNKDGLIPPAPAVPRDAKP